MSLADQLARFDPMLPPDVTVRRAPPAELEEDRAAELEDLTGLALQKMREILQEPTDFDQPKLVQIQLTAASNVLSAQVRVDEGRLKKRKLDILPKLLEAIAKEESRMGVATALLLDG